MFQTTKMFTPYSLIELFWGLLNNSSSPSQGPIYCKLNFEPLTWVQVPYASLTTLGCLCTIQFIEDDFLDSQELVRLIEDGPLDVADDIAVFANDLGKRHFSNLLQLCFAESAIFFSFLFL